MKIGIIGSGNIGASAAQLFVRAGHEVALSNSRGGHGLEVLVAELGEKADQWIGFFIFCARKLERVLFS